MTKSVEHMPPTQLERIHITKALPASSMQVADGSQYRTQENV
jgi:hypothetical protein